VCGLGEFFVQDRLFEESTVFRSQEHEDLSNIYGLLGYSNTRWVAQCFPEGRHPELVSGNRSIQPDSSETLVFGPIEDLKIEGTAATGQSGGLGPCSITVWAAGGLHASRVFNCRPR
jgi:hypothetical protein